MDSEQGSPPKDLSSTASVLSYQIPSDEGINGCHVSDSHFVEATWQARVRQAPEG